MIRSAFFKKLRAMSFLFRKSGNDTGLSEISNDELVTAYEWLTIGDEFPVSFYTPAESVEEALYYGRTDIAATLRKLGAV